MQLRANCLGQAVSTMKHHILASSGNYPIPQQIINFSCKNEFTPIATTHEKKINSPRYELDYYINSSNGKKKNSKGNHKFHKSDGLVFNYSSFLTCGNTKQMFIFFIDRISVCILRACAHINEILL